MGQRRSSWNNLVQVGGDPMAPRQAPPRPAAPAVSTTFSLGSRTSSVLGMQPAPTVFSTQFSVQGQALPMQKVYSTDPRFGVSVPRPAGTIHSSSSLPPSRAPSIVLAPNPSPPIIEKKFDSKNKSKNRNQQPKRNRLQEIKNFCTRPSVMGCALCLLLALIVAIIIIIILSQVLPSPKQATFTWIAPPALTNGQNVSSRVEMKVDQERIRFQMTGAAPIKGNFINYYDFNNNQVIVIDQALSSNGKNLYCFLVPLDRNTMPNPGQVRKAAKNSVLKHQQTEGWQEKWTWIPSPLQQTNSNQNMFNPPIPECNGSRIVQLQSTSDQRNRRCTDCYDFCLPQYGIMKNASQNNEEYLNVVQQDCFYLFVPEWRTYAQANTIEQNQQDFENYYRNRQHMQVSYSSSGPNGSRWIPLSGIPGQMMNATGALVGQVGNAVSNFGGNVYGAITGQQQQQPQQQQQGYVNGNGNGMSYGQPASASYQNGQTTQQQLAPQQQQQQQQLPQQQQQLPQQQQLTQQQQLAPSGYHPAVNGVVNLNGVNGNNGNTEYNTQNGQAIAPEMRRQAPYTFNSNVNSGYTNQQPQVSSGNTNMNGFGAQPSYQTSQYGFNNNNGVNGHQQSTTNTQAPRIGTVLNEFGNPVNIHPAQQQQQQQQQQHLSQYNQPQMGGQTAQNPTQQMQMQMPMQGQQNPNYISTSGGMAPNNNNDNQFTQRLQQLMGTQANYRPDVEQVNYNVPTYAQPNRPDALSRQGRIFK
uniref:BRICHOS domain-containing protein n=1 Tax=Caenorhabditis japonica TaxID=281687 RepID=A0A8R1HK31_CAEJA